MGRAKSAGEIQSNKSNIRSRMQLEGDDGATAMESDVISNVVVAKESIADMETDPTDVGQKRMSGEMEGGGEAQPPSKSNGADADADKDEDKGDGDGGAEDSTGIFPAARVKRIMRKNPDKKKNFAKDTVHVVALATELFLQDMTKQSYQYTTERKRRTMMLNDVGDCIKSVPRLEFLDGPGILPEPSEKAKKAKTTALPTDTKPSITSGEVEAAVEQDKDAAASTAAPSEAGKDTAADSVAQMEIEPASQQQPSSEQQPAVGDGGAPAGVKEEA